MGLYPSSVVEGEAISARDAMADEREVVMRWDETQRGYVPEVDGHRLANLLTGTRYLLFEVSS